MIKAGLFDMDGVLMNKEKNLTKFWQKAQAEEELFLTMKTVINFEVLQVSSHLWRFRKNTEKNMIIFQFVHEEKN